MSEFSFMARRGPILVEASASGPADSMDLQLILDTGATTTMLSEDVIRYLGYDPELESITIEFTTTGGPVTRPIITLNRLSALGQHRLGVDVIVHSIPGDTKVDGLLGLDFLRGHALSINFVTGRISLD